MSSGQLLKMKLVAYDDIGFTTQSGDSYEVLINPESYALTYASETSDKSAQGSSESITSFNKRSPQSLTFKFLFDGTGVIQRGGGGLLSGLAVPGLPANKPDVMQDYQNFKSVVYQYAGDTHQPRFVQLQWGPLLYNCQATRMTITFKLFNPDGSPLRAEAECTFQGVIDEVKLAAIEGRQSPDLTHVRTVKDGDTLPLICYREYGDSKYYYQVAQFNGLTDFKNLQSGTKIILPPITT
ncbi:CIS tube protein [Mucilaginibacter sp. X4EP1]|uniref:CIS tube protein n=1 Tax=Mucilaginibacter sp. X4EP1 TaxID=2723092 RepID=UPI0021677A25|nr:tail protein X [Mucilaginibacter sp. X4EP1]MCS3816011.1 phage tail protein X [Mucilaginibacter sp. X4EP1]